MKDRDQRSIDAGIQAEKLLQAGLDTFIDENIDNLTQELVNSSEGEQILRENLYIQIQSLTTLLTKVRNNQKAYRHLMSK